MTSQDAFTGKVLDAGCGTGDNAIYVAAQGLSVFGFDVAETAVTLARENAERAGVEVEFAVADALQLERLGQEFDTVLDCGLFHTFDGEEQRAFAASVASVTEHDATLYVLCFNDEGPGTGPHPVSKDELASAFIRDTGWNLVAVQPDRIHTRFHGDDGASAWLAMIKRI